MVFALYSEMNSLKDEVELLEKKAIINALDECGWIQARAAVKLGITERMIGYKINIYMIKIKKGTHLTNEY